MSQAPHNSSRRGAKRSAEDHASVVPIRATTDTLENTLPPTPLRELLAADGASVYVLSREPGLLEIVKQAAGEQYPIYPADSWSALCEAITEGHCGIALLDIDAMAGTLQDRLTELARLNPTLVVLLASSRERADALLDLLSQRKIHRLLIKPPTVGITRLMIESSVNRYLELRRRPEAHGTSAQVQPSTVAGLPKWLLASGLVLGLLAAVGITIYLTQAREEGVVSSTTVRRPAVESTLGSPSPRPAMPVSEPAAQADLTVPAFLEDAALADAALTSAPVAVAGPFPVEAPEPAGPTAAELEARYAEVEAALVADDLDAAAALLDELAGVDAASSRLAFLNAQLARSRAAAELATTAAAAAIAAEAAANPSELASLISLTRTRLARGQIDAPAGDNAVTYFSRARDLDATAPEVTALAAEIGSALVGSARSAIAAGRLESAEALLTRAQGLGGGAAGIAAAELSLNVAREARTRDRQDELLSAAAERQAQGLLFEPATESALDAVLDARELNPEHPDLASAVTSLQADLSASATTAIAAGGWERAEASIDALERLGAAEAVTQPLREDLAFGRAQEAYLAQAAPAAELEVLEFAPPVYPERALTRGAQGWVDLEFIVDREGRPRDLVVMAAEPPGEFDAAALAAVGNYVFVPFEQAGRVYERRIGLRLRFALQ
jgi:TonB family protein